METNRVQVKLVVFPTNKNEWNNNYCSYCPAIRDFCARGNTIPEVIKYAEMRLKEELQDRVSYNTLEKCGWKVSENSAIPPIFADEELVLQTECCFGIKISNYQIIELDVEVPDKSSYNKFDDYDPNFKRLIQKALAYNPRKTKNKG